MSTPDQSSTLVLADIQGAVLRERPSPYVGRYFLFRLDDAKDGCQLLRRLIPYVATAANWQNPPEEAVINLALTYQGLKALGVPQSSLDSFPVEFQQGMAARAEDVLSDTGDSSPANWEKPFGTPDVHLALSLTAPDAGKLEEFITAAGQALQGLSGVSIIYQHDAEMLPTGRTHFGYRDGIGQPLIEGSGSDAYPGQDPLLKPGSLLLGHPDTTGQVQPIPQPEVLGRNGTFMAFRILHERVATFRQFLRDNSADPAAEELLAAKIVGRWPSGAPLILCPEQDDPTLGADPERNNNFTYADDPIGLKCPRGAHMRRANPRDALYDSLTDVTLHRCLRRGTTYGPALPEGVMEDDGVDRGIVFIFLGASLKRQYEFVKSQWQNDGDFVGLGTEKDALVGANDGTGVFTIPQRPIRRRLENVPRFTITRGGEYCFVPSISALEWLASLNEGA